jgi:hypothetical protein
VGLAEEQILATADIEHRNGCDIPSRKRKPTVSKQDRIYNKVKRSKAILPQ